MLHFLAKGSQDHENLRSMTMCCETSAKRNPNAYLVKELVLSLNEVHNINPLYATLTIAQRVQLRIMVRLAGAKAGSSCANTTPREASTGTYIHSLAGRLQGPRRENRVKFVL